MDGHPRDGNRNDQRAVYNYLHKRDGYTKADAEELVKNKLVIIVFNSNHDGDRLLLYRPNVGAFTLLYYGADGELRRVN